MKEGHFHFPNHFSLLVENRNLHLYNNLQYGSNITTTGHNIFSQQKLLQMTFPKKKQKLILEI